MNFNTAQLEAIHTIEGPVMAVACPGSGKTTMVIERTCEMLRRGISSESIVVMTFTKAAADEMQARFQKKSEVEGVRFGTIHSVCLEILKTEYPYPITVLPGFEQWNFFKSICHLEEDQNDTIKNMIMEISVVRNNGIKLADYDPESCSKSEFQRIFKAYREYKKENGKLDFDDILVKVDQIFHLYPKILEKWQDTFRYITVDEFQDVNRLQADIIYLLARKYQNLCIVGDDDQSIYQFRGAKPEIMLNFQKEFPTAKRIDMGTNYRSEPDIVKHASALIQKNGTRFQKEIKAQKTGTGVIQAMFCPSEDWENQAILDKIKAFHAKGIPYSEMAVLYRTNEENVNLAMALINQRIPYTCTEEIRGLHEHFIFKDIQAYYRIVSNTATRKDYCRVLNRPNRYIPSRTVPKEFASEEELKESLLTYACTIPEQWRRESVTSKIKAFFRLIKLLRVIKKPEDFFEKLYKFGYSSFLKQYKETHQSEAMIVDGMLKRVKNSLPGCSNMKDWFAAVECNDQILHQNLQKKDTDSVTLSTLHGSKGLEWQVVFIINVNPGTIPFEFQGECDMEEERRLFYVGITRAKSNLYLLRTDIKSSPFIKEMKLKS